MEENKYSFEIVDGVGIIPTGTKKVPKGAFRECEELRKIVIPEGVTHICEYAFYKCINLREVTLPSTLKYLEHCALAECSSLKEIVLPAGLKGIDQYALSKNKFDSITFLSENPKAVSGYSYKYFDESRSDIANTLHNCKLTKFTKRIIVPTNSFEVYCRELDSEILDLLQDSDGNTYEVKEQRRIEAFRKDVEINAKKDAKQNKTVLIVVGIAFLIVFIMALFLEN